MADIQNNVPNMPTGSVVAQGGSTAMELDQQGGTGGGGIAAENSNGILANIRPLVRTKKMVVTFKKRWYKYTYGISHTNIPAVKCVKRICTPYAYYPVDWLPF